MFKDDRALNRGWPPKIKGWLAWVVWPKVLLLVAFIEGLWFVVFLKFMKFDKGLKCIKMPICPEAMALSSFQGVISWAHPWVALSLLKWAVLPPLWKQPLESTAASLLEGSVCCSFSCVTCCHYLLSKAHGVCKHCCLPVSFMSFNLT